MSASPLPIFRLPSLITKNILMNMGPFELFCLSTLSARTERVVKAYSRRRNFKVRSESGWEPTLRLRESLSNDPELKIEFEITDGSGTVYLPATNTVHVYCEDDTEAMPTMLEHLSTTFKINSIDLVFDYKEEEAKSKINNVVQRLNLKIDDYCDYWNDYNYEELESIMRSECVHISNAQFTDNQIGRLFQKCIERPEPIQATFNHGGTPDLFTKIFNMVKGDPQVFPTQYGGNFRLTQEDGRFIAVSVARGLVTIHVTAKK